MIPTDQKRLHCTAIQSPKLHIILLFKSSGRTNETIFLYGTKKRRLNHAMFGEFGFCTEMNVHSCNVSQLVRKAYVDERFRWFVYLSRTRVLRPLSTKIRKFQDRKFLPEISGLMRCCRRRNQGDLPLSKLSAKVEKSINQLSWVLSWRPFRGKHSNR